MPKPIAFNHLTLDGYFVGPNRGLQLGAPG
jgi:hypothetical protein